MYATQLMFIRSLSKPATVRVFILFGATFASVSHTPIAKSRQLRITHAFKFSSGVLLSHYESL